MGHRTTKVRRNLTTHRAPREPARRSAVVGLSVDGPRRFPADAAQRAAGLHCGRRRALEARCQRDPHATGVIAMATFGLLRFEQSSAAAAREWRSLRCATTDRCPERGRVSPWAVTRAFSTANSAERFVAIGRPPRSSSGCAGKSIVSIALSDDLSIIARRWPALASLIRTSSLTVIVYQIQALTASRDRVQSVGSRRRQVLHRNRISARQAKLAYPSPEVSDRLVGRPGPVPGVAFLGAERTIGSQSGGGARRTMRGGVAYHENCGK